MSRKILITGFSGFVSQYFIEYLYDNNIDFDICGVDIVAPRFSLLKYKSSHNISFHILDMTDKEKVYSIISLEKPEYVLHLASYSSVAYSWKEPNLSFMNNCNIFLNLIEAIRIYSPNARILSVGSSEEYGNVDESQLPLEEEITLKPISPYAVARVSQEHLSQVFVRGYGMDIVLTRSFNHIGPRQDLRFVVPSFIERILKYQKDHIRKKDSLEMVRILVGDVDIVRDFLDVRDVVRAYYMLLMKGGKGEVYNVCSGIPYRLSDVIDTIGKIIGIEVEAVQCNELIRPVDIRTIIGNPNKLINEIGWKQNIPLDMTLSDMIEYQKRFL